MEESQITQINKSLWPSHWGEKTSIMGVINITPDSFSDGGQYEKPINAISRANDLILAGADVLDIGAQSTRPGANTVGSDEELKRLLPALIPIRNRFPSTIISVDTFHAKVAEKSIEIGVNWINDISAGIRDPDILNVISNANCPYVLTHSRGNSKTMNTLNTYHNLIPDIIEELKINTENALKAGIQEKNIIWDPGIGFAKNTEQNILILKNLNEFNKYQFPVLVGPSRKRFIGDILKTKNINDRLYGTLAVVSRCVQENIAMVRVHDVKPIYDFIKMLNTL